jgi:tRNA pseudouridine55 synthase
MKSNIDYYEQDLILTVNKPPGWTSFDVVKKIRVLTKIKKVGHAGTLDPFAEGLLIICTGNETKKITDLIRKPKKYQAKIALGFETDTMDLTGQIIQEMPVPDISEEKIREVISSYSGEIQQEIPKFSAAKYRGQRLYKLARKGKEVPCLFKKVNIYEIKLLSHSKKVINIAVDCSSGTYIRTLARDICKDLQTAGHVRSLIRTRIGDYHLDNALTIEELIEIYNSERTVV